MSDNFFSYLGQGILAFLDRISCLFSSSVCPTVISHICDKEYLLFSIAFLVYFGVRYVPQLFLISGPRNTNFSRSHFLFILEFGMSDRFFFSFLGQGILTFLDCISCLFWSSVFRQFLLISGTRNTSFSRSHFLFIFEFGMSDSYFSYLRQGILTFLDRISCLFWSSVCRNVFSHIWDKEY